MRVLVNCKCEMTQFAAFNTEFCCEQRTIMQSSRDVQWLFMRASHKGGLRLPRIHYELIIRNLVKERIEKNNLIAVAVSSIF